MMPNRRETRVTKYTDLWLRACNPRSKMARYCILRHQSRRMARLEPRNPLNFHLLITGAPELLSKIAAFASETPPIQTSSRSTKRIDSASSTMCHTSSRYLLFRNTSNSPLLSTSAPQSFSKLAHFSSETSPTQTTKSSHTPS